MTHLDRRAKPAAARAIIRAEEHTESVLTIRRRRQHLCGPAWRVAATHDLSDTDPAITVPKDARHLKPVHPPRVGYSVLELNELARREGERVGLEVCGRARVGGIAASLGSLHAASEAQ